MSHLHTFPKDAPPSLGRTVRPGLGRGRSPRHVVGGWDPCLWPVGLCISLAAEELDWTIRKRGSTSPTRWPIRIPLRNSRSPETIRM